MSQTGFRLLAPMSVGNAVTLGTLDRDPPARPGRLGARHRAPDAAAHRRSRRNRAAGDREHARRRRPGRAAQGDERRLFGRRRSRRRSTAGSFHGLFLSLRKRESDPAVQSLIVPAVEYQPAQALPHRHVRIAPSDAKLGRLLEQQPDWVWAAVEPLEITSAARRAGAQAGRLSRAPMAVDRYAEIRAAYRWDVPDDFNIAHALLRPLGGRPRALRAVLGRRVRRAPRATRSGICSSDANRLSNALAALGVRARRQGRAHPAAAARDRRRAHRGLPARRDRGAAVVPVRSRGARVPARRIREAKVAIVDPQSLPNLAADPRAAARHLAHVDRRRRRARDRASRRSKRCSAAASPQFTPVATRGRRSRAPHLHQRHDRPAEGRADAAPLPDRQPARASSIRTTGFRATGDLFWSPADWAWTGGLMDALLPTLYFGQPIVGYRGRFDPERAFALIEKYQRPQHVPVPDRAEDDDEGVPAAARALRRRAAQHHERRRGGRHDGVRMGAATRSA